MRPADSRKIRRKLEKELDTKHFEHTLGVAYTAASLAMCHDVDINKAITAGLLHDCAKCFEDEKLIATCNKHNIRINDVEYQSPYLLHAKVGSFLAMKKYYINDQDIINAILNHTTGRPNMTQLEKIIYIADYIEPSRKIAPNLNVIRKLAFRDVDATVLKIMEDTIDYLKKSGSLIDPMTLKAVDYYLTICSISKNN